MQRKVIEIEPEKCTGCKMCEMVCSLKNEGVCGSSYSNIRIVREDENSIDLPVFCMQCDDAPCEKVCPVNAIRKQGDVLVINQDVCIGCRACSVVCPVGALSYFPGKNSRIVAHKCDLCKDEEPACVKFCPTDALKVVTEEKMGRYKHFNLLDKLKSNSIVVNE